MFFFDESTTPASEESYLKLSDLLGRLKKDVDEATNLKDIAGNIASQFTRIVEETEQLNKQLVAGRTRFQEFSRVINEATPGVVRLGGSYEDVRKTIFQIAEGSRRQVAASAEDVEKLFAAGKLLGTNVKDIVNNFAAAGISYDKIATKLSDSINYVQNIGLNARTVMADVTKNTESLSRFNFQNGVQGLTKMAAQASMMRLDMSKTFEFAEGVLDPEKAVETAAAFQRLGVSVGNLTDPFQLMNQSINDPSGLQTSIINVTKQFTYFDEQSKSFKINPQGILTLKELAPTIGITATELRKTALAAAEMDNKLKKINETGFGLKVSEEDKMLVANIATMGKGGEYEVSIKDEQGYEYQKKLTELQEEDFQRLLEQQKKAPQSIEEIQRAQLNYAEKMYAELKGLKETVVAGALGLPGMGRTMEAGANMFSGIGTALNKTLADVGFQRTLEQAKIEIQTIVSSKRTQEQKDKEIDVIYQKLKKDMLEKGSMYLDRAGVNISQLGDKQTGVMKSFTETIETLLSKAGLGGQTGKKGAGVSTDFGDRYTTDYGIITGTPNPNLPNTNQAFQNLLVGGKTGVTTITVSPTINMPAVTYQPPDGIKTPQELMDVFKKGGQQISEEMAKSIYSAMQTLGLLKK